MVFLLMKSRLFYSSSQIFNFACQSEPDITNICWELNNKIEFIKCYLDLSGKCLLLRVKYFLAEIFNLHLGPPIYYYCIVQWGSLAHEVLVVYLPKESSCLPLIGSSDWDQSWRENGHWTTPPTAHQPRCMISERPKNMYISLLLYRIEYGHQIITTKLFAK